MSGQLETYLQRTARILEGEKWIGDPPYWDGMSLVDAIKSVVPLRERTNVFQILNLVVGNLYPADSSQGSVLSSRLTAWETSSRFTLAVGVMTVHEHNEYLEAHPDELNVWHGVSRDDVVQLLRAAHDRAARQVGSG